MVIIDVSLIRLPRVQGSKKFSGISSLNFNIISPKSECKRILSNSKTDMFYLIKYDIFYLVKSISGPENNFLKLKTF